MTKVLIKKDKPNIFTFFTMAILGYYAYDKFSSGKMVYGGIIAVFAGLALIHNILLLTTPLLIHQDEYLIIRPKIPFEKKNIPLEEIKDVKIGKESVLILYLTNGKNFKMSLGGFSSKETQAVRKYILGLVGEEE